jgi:Transposase DDE domain
MPATLTQVVKQFQQEWTTQLEPEAILSVCHDIGYEWRERCLDPVTTMQCFFVQIVNGNTACTHLRHLTKLDVSASAYCQARTRLPLEVFNRLLRAVGDDLQREPLEEGRWLGHRTFWADGSSFSMSDTPELQDHFGQPGGQQPGCGFPVAHLMGLFHAGTGMVLKMLSAPLRTHDLSQVVRLHPELRPGDVLVTDRGLCSYAHLALLAQGGVHAVVRMHQNQIVNFTPGRPHVEPGKRGAKGQKGLPRSRWVRQLGPQDQVVHWPKPVSGPEWMTPEQYAQLPEHLRLRELRYRVLPKGFRVKTITLVTTLVDAERYRVEDLADLFFARWGIETNLAHLKTTMGLDVLKCKTVNGVLKELMVFALIYNCIRLVMSQAARRQQVAIERISFIDAMRWLASAQADEPLPTLVVNRHRPNRYELRVRKRRPKPYPLMTKPRPELRKLLANKTHVD